MAGRKEGSTRPDVSSWRGALQAPPSGAAELASRKPRRQPRQRRRQQLSVDRLNDLLVCKQNKNELAGLPSAAVSGAEVARSAASLPRARTAQNH
ncbi:unnamed protein product [Calypogeia fissa]